MMFNHLQKTLFITVTLFVSTHCIGADLVSVYRLAEKNAPTYLQKIAAQRAVLESRSQALAQLLPAINLRADTVRNDQDISSSNNFGSSGKTNFNSRGYTLSLSQPLYRRDRFIALNQTDSRIDQAEAELDDVHQGLILRIAERYFDVLAKIDDLAFAQAEVKALGRQQEQATQRFAVGLSAITDVQETQSGYDLAVAREIQAFNAIENAQEAMRELTGDYIRSFNPLGDAMPLVRPDPDAIDYWTQLSLEQNLMVIVANHAAKTTRKEIKRQSAGHYPTLDLVASKSYDSSGGRFGSNKTDATTIGLELNIPLYSGGLLSSKTREAHENHNIAMHKLEQTRRTAQRLTREAYLGVISGISQVNALSQAVVSSETALQATTAGFEVGTRTAVDVVAAQRATSQARRDYSQARYNYILDTMRLKRAVGTLSPDDLALINTWLTVK